MVKPLIKQVLKAFGYFPKLVVVLPNSPPTFVMTTTPVMRNVSTAKRVILS